ncbi:MAG: YeeE/YedE thiosulfate transporter family protein [Pseudomonadota bacterium]|nr:YeeE/YedE thiosulfate transporter family protein [Pseudomonadota bacterium]MDP1906024.1 YeeE/YedE thiosulfate transporter family protein [Pseudomonadota bacterium]MDP2352495.1 YeeE/YedE thiosulfate transporter family protein [Pseudomonadota bacterium]
MNVKAGTLQEAGWMQLNRQKIYPAGILLAVAVGSLWALSIDTRFLYLLVYVWFGVIYGLFLQYGRFCMAAAVRDLFAVKVPRMAVGMMIAVGLYALAAAAVTLTGHNTFHAHALGWHVLVGGLVFGFGFVFTGGCASGSLYKTGEGNLNSALVIFSISFSQALVVTAGGWLDALAPSAWAESAAAKGMPDELSVTQGWFDMFTAGYIWDRKGATLAEMLGMGEPGMTAIFINTFVNAIFPVLIILVALYFFYYRKSYLRKTAKTAPTLADELGGLWHMCISSKNTAIAGVGLGIFAGLHMWVTGVLREHYNIFNFGELLSAMGYNNGLSIDGSVFDPGYWYITTQEAQWGGWVLENLGFEMRDNVFFGLENGLPNPLLNAPGFMSIGIILGAAVLALARREFKWKMPTVETATFAIVGGILMGIGARLAMGCNIGAFFATVTNGDPSGWIFLIGMVGGGYVGVKVFTYWMDWKMARDGGCGL